VEIYRSGAASFGAVDINEPVRLGKHMGAIALEIEGGVDGVRIIPGVEAAHRNEIESRSSCKGNRVSGLAKKC
jgi:hypothetical protein